MKSGATTVVLAGRLGISVGGVFALIGCLTFQNVAVVPVLS